MPKKVIHTFLDQLARDINCGYASGDRYLSTRQIAEKFNVSLQTAHRGIRMFAEKGIFETKAKSGIIIRSLDCGIVCKRKTLLVVSNNPDSRFNQAFMDGIASVSGKTGMKAVLEVNTHENTQSLSFGEHLMSLYNMHQSAGVIALYFRNTDLAFYHVLNKNIPLVSDIISDNLPIMASVQTNNPEYCKEAADRFCSWDKKEVLICSFWDEGNARHRYFKKEISRLGKTVKLTYLDLKDQHYPAKLFAFFNSFDSGKGVFSLDYSANYAIAPYFVINNIDYKRNLLVYDSEDDDFIFKGHKIGAVAPSLKRIGESLARKLISRLNSGKWSEPLNEKI